MNTRSRSLRWDRDGRVTLLAALPGDTDTHVAAINNDGTAVGQSYTLFGAWHAVRWDDHGRVARLPGVAGSGDWGYASEINARGIVCGLSGGHAVLWDRCDHIIDLTALTG